jgi:predicted dehydrogenase
VNKLRLGMLGGGLGSMIGDIHRYAARLDNCYELKGGAFSTDYEKSMRLGHQLGLSTKRIYKNADDLFTKEMHLPEKERLQVITIATPNYLHYEMTEKALALGFHVILEKPITCTLEQAYRLHEFEKKTCAKVCVLYTYLGYPMIKEARPH